MVWRSRRTRETAGVIPKPFWNSAQGAASDTPLALVDETGATTTATVTWMCDNAYKLPKPDQPGDQRMMNGHPDTGNANPTTVTVTGLLPGVYDVYVYADGDNGGATRMGLYNDIGLIDAANTNFSGVYTEANNSAGNYVKFTFTGSTFTLTATPGTASDNTRRAPVNGIQIIPSDVAGHS